MKRGIFIGSSSEGLSEAERLKELLDEHTAHGVECELWPNSFDPGSLTFQALEDMLQRNCAAVFVAKAEDSTTIRGEEKMVPRANVMLEFGLVAGRLGRHNIALCRYGGAHLPSDLTGMTVIDMDPPGPCESWTAELRDKFSKEAAKKLKMWSLRLLSTAEDIPRTILFHGYTGRWSFELRLSRWRGADIGENSYAQVNGWIDIFVDADGRSGAGFAHGRMSFLLAAAQPFAGEIRIAHQIRDVHCFSDGTMDFTSVLYSLHFWRRDGDASMWPGLAGLGGPPEPWMFNWHLEPKAGFRKLAGKLDSTAGRTEGTIEAVKTNASSASAAEA